MHKARTIEKLTGSSEGFSLEHRIFNIFSLLSIILALLAGFLNYRIGLHLIMVIIPLGFALLMGYCFYYSRIKKRYQMPAFLSTLVMVILAPVMWIGNGGTMGGAQYFFILLGMLVPILYTGRLRYILLVLFLAMLASLITLEYLHPELIVYVNSRSGRFWDVLVSFILAAASMVMLFIVFADGYRNEHERVKQYSRHLEEVAVTDGQTGLYNHRFVLKRLEEEISKARRYKRKFSIIMLDIDHFKKLNDTQGHQYGDYVLVRIAEIIRENVRAIDTIGRYGGEEFIILCAETGLAEAYMLANRLRGEIERTVFRRQVRVTISGGVAELQDDNAKQLVEKADRCLYSAKRLGRNRIGV